MRSLCRGCKRRQRPFLSSTIATRARRTRREDQQVCPPFFPGDPTNAVAIVSCGSRCNLSVFSCPLTQDVGLVMQGRDYRLYESILITHSAITGVILLLIHIQSRVILSQRMIFTPFITSNHSRSFFIIKNSHFIVLVPGSWHLSDMKRV